MLEKIKTPEDLKKLHKDEILSLCAEMRRKICETVENNGGHLASNLGMIETTVALHRVFDSPNDSIIFDVGHQCYAHKLLTGRYEKFGTLRTFGGLSGFTNRNESPHDIITAGHSGSSLPTAMGIAKANALDKNGNFAVAVIGDASFTNGMISEALNCCDDENLNLIIVLNDNEMSISKNVGSFSHYFTRLRNSKKYFAFKHILVKICRKLPFIGKYIEKISHAIKQFFKNLFLSKNLFENMGLYYLGPVDGNDEAKMEEVLREAKTKNAVTIVHTITLKGKGHIAAEKTPTAYHFVSPGAASIETFSSVFGSTLALETEKNKNIIAITAAMTDGTGLKTFKEKHPDNFIDVGIAEECAVTCACGLSYKGKIPVCALYSTFLQRTFDQITEDLALQNAHAVLAIDRAGLVPGDGPTHQGVFDVSLLAKIPNITLFSPETFEELKICLKKSISGSGLNAVRYAKGAETVYDRSGFLLCENGDFTEYNDSEKSDILIITYGNVTKNAFDAAKILEENYTVKIIKLIKLLPFSPRAIIEKLKNAELVYILEEGVKSGGIGEKIASFISENQIMTRVHIRAVNGFLPHGDIDSLQKLCGFDAQSIANEINSLLRIELTV